MATRNLYSAQRELLGTITYPDAWDKIVQEHAYYLFPFFGEKKEPTLLDYAMGAPFVPHAALSRAPGDPSSVNLWGITPQEFSHLEDCAFSWVPRTIVA